MFLLVLDKNPYEAAMKIPDYYKHKQLLELMQMTSCVVNFRYKQLPQGKEIKQWIEKHSDWTFVFAKTLLSRLKLTEETRAYFNFILKYIHPEKRITFIKVRAHSGDSYNEMADNLARRALKENKKW